jgi:alanyl aminopeptidase
VLTLLAEARDPAVLEELSRIGRAYAGPAGGTFRAEVVDPDLATLALGVAVEEGDDALFDLLDRRLGTLDDSELRERILVALGSARDPRRSARARELALDARLRRQETIVPLISQSQDERTRDASWAFFKEHFEAIAASMPNNYAAFLPYVVLDFCDGAHADEAVAFFEPRVAKHNGMSKNLRQAVETVRLCSAGAAAQKESARAFFAARAGKKVSTAPAR